jgi:hypothetical protein
MDIVRRKQQMTSLAEQIHQGLATEDQVFAAGFELMREQNGMRTARYYFYYNEDFPADFISEYFSLQKQAAKTVGQ